MTAETVQKSADGKGIWFLLAGLTVVNLLVGFFLAPRHVALEHTPIVQFPNFLAFLGVPGTWLPAHVTFTWLVMALLVVGSVMATRALKAVPGPLQNFAEVVLEAFFDLLEQMIGKQGRQFLPLVGTVGLFILTSNLLGNLPGFQAPTANWNTTVALALTVFVWYNYAGVRKHGLVGYLKHFCGPIWWLAPIMFPIEFIGHLARPVSLSVRLFGNIFGEESVIGILISLAWLVMPYMIWLGVMLPLSLFTAAVQTFVFIMLTMVYIAGAVEEGHGEGQH
ncbi:MAG: F0F1 ATP synthase subunit A [candidate division NC10 bacterium]|nr:F0F1 ATP synthase subunit A [candidate division NC10 bacterium]